MKRETCKLMCVTDWKKIEFYLKFYPSRVDGWGIHLDEDKVNTCLQLAICILITVVLLVTLTD